MFAQPDVFAVVNCCLSAVLCSGLLTGNADIIIYVHFSDTLYNSE